MKTITKGIWAGALSVLFALPAVAEEAKDDKPAEATTEEEAKTEGTETEADADVKEEAEDEEEAGKDWSVSFAVGNTIGQGTFVNIDPNDEFTDPACTELQNCVGDPKNAFDRANLSFVLAPGYTLGDFSFGASFALVQWLTPGGGSIEPQETRFQDIGLEVGHAGYTFESIGLSVSPSVSFGLPTSKASQTSSLIVGTGVGVGLSKTFFEKLSLSLSVGGGKDFHRFTSPRVRIDEVGPENILYRAGESEDLGRGLIALDGVNTEWSLSTGIGASMPIWDKLRASASYGLGTYWTYDVFDEDEFTPDIEGINTNRGVAQISSTRVSLSYPVWSYEGFNLGASAGIATAQYPKTADNRSFRFPFWNFEGAASNASSIKLGLSASY